MDDWRAHIPPEAWSAYRNAGYGAGLNLGGHPALLVVDATLAFTGPAGATMDEAVAAFPGACGPAAWEAVPRMAEILALARLLTLPVAYTIGANPHWLAWSGRPKHDLATSHVDPAGREVVEPLRPRAGELVLDKLRPSAFYCTPLLPLLIARRVDTVIVVGGTTSGCVRSTAVDAFSTGLAPIVVDDAVFDRSAMSHAVSLFELGQKYANIQATEWVLSYLESLRLAGA